MHHAALVARLLLLIFSRAFQREQASSELGLTSRRSRAILAWWMVSASARFMQNSVSNNFSVSSILSGLITLCPLRRLVRPVLSQVGQNVKSNFMKWAETCGDEYVAEIKKGAKLLILYSHRIRLRGTKAGI